MRGLFAVAIALAALLVSGCVLRSGDDDDGGTADGGALDAAIDVPEPDAPVDAAPDGAIDADTTDAVPPADADTTDAAPLTAGASTLAGRGDPGLVDGDRNTALFDDPVNVVVAPDGEVYVADFNNGAIRHITPEGDVTTEVVQAGFSRPFGMVFGSDGTFYVQTDRNSAGELKGALWKVNLATHTATRIEDSIGRFRGMALLSDGRLVLADYQEHYLATYDPFTRALVPLAGLPGTRGYQNGVGEQARFDQPYDLAVAPGDVIIVSDFGNHRLRLVTLDGTVTTLTGGNEATSTDGTLATARFVSPQGLARDPQGRIYVSDPGAHVIRRVVGNQVTTVAGDGMLGYVESLDPRTARFYGIEGIDITADGQYLYIADGNFGDGMPYHRVRRIQFTGD